MRFYEIYRKQKDADQVKANEPKPMAKKGRTKHPFVNRLVGEDLLAEGARIQHAEDIIFWEGSKGAVRTVEALKSLEQGNHSSVTIKWDGSPAIIFGRDQNGNFILTDKSGFSAKTYDGKSKSPKELEKMLLNRKTSRGIEPDDKFRQFAGNMRDIFDEYEKATPKDHRGFFKGDLLYYNTPLLVKGLFTFKPNIVTYAVDAKSDLGKKIALSKTGVVIHNAIDVDGNSMALEINPESYFIGNEVLVVPPVTIQEPPQINDSQVKNIQALISKHASSIDSLLDINQLSKLKLSDFSNILYTYTNSKVGGTLTDLGNDFTTWLSNSKLSNPKKQNILTYISSNKSGFEALWKIVNSIQVLKNNIIDQLETQDAPVKAYIADKPGGEGFVLDHPEGAIKLVNRSGFTAANRAVER